MSGCVRARSLKPASTLLLVQTGQPLFTAVLLATVADHRCPFGHCHSIFLPDPCVTEDGSQPTACAATSGWVRSIVGFTLLRVTSRFSTTTVR